MAAYFKYLQIADLLKKQITGGQRSGKMPSESELCKEFNVSRSCMRQALQQLAKGGLIAKSQGAPTRIEAVKFSHILFRKKLLFLHYGENNFDDNPVYDLLRNTLLEQSVQIGIHIEVLFVSPELLRKHPEQFQKRIERADGIFDIGCPFAIEKFKEIFRILRNKENSITLDSILNKYSSVSIGTDNYSGGRMAARAFFNANRKNPVLIAPAQGQCTRYAPFLERNLGFRDEWISLHDQQSDKKIITIQHAAELHTIEQEFCKLLKDQQIDSIFALTDPFALSAIEILRRQNISVPEQISVIGFDGIGYDGLGVDGIGYGEEKINLCTICHPIRGIVQKAIVIMIAMLSGQPLEYEILRLKPSIKYGQTLLGIQ